MQCALCRKTWRGNNRGQGGHSRPYGTYGNFELEAEALMEAAVWEEAAGPNVAAGPTEAAGADRGERAGLGLKIRYQISE